MGVADAPGARIAFDVDGPVDAPAVAFIHAGVANRTMWDPQWADLARDHRVVRHDTRGFGATVGDATPFSDVDDLLAVLDAAGVERPTLVGASRGGRIALDTALAHPDRVAGVVTLGSSPSGWTPGPLTPREQELDEAIDAAFDAGDRDALLPLELQSGSPDRAATSPSSTPPSSRARPSCCAPASRRTSPARPSPRTLRRPTGWAASRSRPSPPSAIATSPC